MDIERLKDNDIRALKESFMFKDVSEDVLYRALKDERCLIKDYAAGERVMDENSFSRSLCYVVSGKISAVKVTDTGEIPLRIIAQYGFFGVAALFNGEDSYISRITAVKKSRVIFFPQSLVTELISFNSRMALSYIEFLTRRIHFLDAKINLFISSSGKNALAEYLCSLMEEGENILHLDTPYTKIASLLNMSRASLYRAFDALEESGLIKRDGRDIYITDPKKLMKSRENQ